VASAEGWDKRIGTQGRKDAAMMKSEMSTFVCFGRFDLKMKRNKARGKKKIAA